MRLKTIKPIVDNSRIRLLCESDTGETGYLDQSAFDAIIPCGFTGWFDKDVIGPILETITACAKRHLKRNVDIEGGVFYFSSWNEVGCLDDYAGGPVVISIKGLPFGIYVKGIDRDSTNGATWLSTTGNILQAKIFPDRNSAIQFLDSSTVGLDKKRANFCFIKPSEYANLRGQQFLALQGVTDQDQSVIDAIGSAQLGEEVQVLKMEAINKPPDENYGYSNGEKCNRNGCTGIIKDDYESYPCSCHLNPPCSNCENGRGVCLECRWDAQEEIDFSNMKKGGKNE